MQVYRLSKQIYSKDIEGVGSKLYGGRWNNIGIPCIYTSESRALAILEYSVNIELNIIPKPLNITIYEVLESEFLEFKVNELPGDWQNSPCPQSTKNFGSKFLLNREFLGLKLPSVVVPEEYNYLINPQSVKISLLKVVDALDFVFDVRVKM